MSTAAQADEASAAAAEAGGEALVAALRAHQQPTAATRTALTAALAAVVSLTAKPGRRSAPACTYVSAVVTDRSVTVGWVGDSRAYWVPGDQDQPAPPTRLTEDDSWAAHAAGSRPPTGATRDWRAHAITAWLGADADELDPHIVTLEPDASGVVVVCTDGLWNYLDSAEELAAGLPPRASAAPLEAARELVQVALEAGGRDNVTVAVLPFVTSPEGAVS